MLLAHATGSELCAAPNPGGVAFLHGTCSPMEFNYPAHEFALLRLLEQVLEDVNAHASCSRLTLLIFAQRSACGIFPREIDAFFLTKHGTSQRRNRAII